jgi:hypothetical protein
VGDAASIGFLESTSVAALGRIEVITLDYRQSEAKFPACEEVAAVYRELLKNDRARDIGIFGCSAGGLLSAQAIVHFKMKGFLCRPRQEFSAHQQLHGGQEIVGTGRSRSRD